MGKLGTGSTISIPGLTAAEILDISGPSLKRDSIGNSHMGTTAWHDFLPADLVDGGEVTVEIAYEGGVPSITAAAASVTIVFGSGGSGGDNELTFDAFITGFEPKAPLEDRMTATVTFKVTGDVA